MDAKKLANWIVERRVEAGDPITPFQLQRVLFCIEIEHIRRHGTPVFFNPIEAWDNGPIVPEVWWQYAHFGTMPITIAIGKGRLDPSLDEQLIAWVVDEKAEMHYLDLMKEVCSAGGSWERRHYVGKHCLILPSDIERWDIGRMD
jgi:uncharacterized phage-associated protein